MKSEAPKLIKKYLEDTEDFSDVKATKMVKHTLLNNDSSYRIDNDYMVFKLSTYGNKNITIVKGNNEVGKTTIMNAITWCLYGKEY